RELSTWSQLRHKGIAELLGLALFKGQLAMVSTWNKHGNVMSYIEQQPHMDRYALASILGSRFHASSFKVHGDLKGANILVSADGALQLTDFGLTIMHDATIHFSKSANEVSGGTLRWMVKENESGSNPQPKLCKETDIYALGMVSDLEIFTGKRPFKELEKDTAVILALSKGKRPHRPKKILDQSPRGVPFWDILQKCWAQTPGDRPTASEVDTSVGVFVPDILPQH
ncbi:kinase-like protein, partial [Ceratobasidium sp. AG-I]